MRETTFYPKLCLIQMASAEEVVLVDPLVAGPRSRALPRAHAQPERREGGPFGPAGPRDPLEHRRLHPDAPVRHPGRRDGLRLRRQRLLRTARPRPRQSQDRQVVALHRLVEAAAHRGATRLCPLGRDASAPRLSGAGQAARADPAGLPWLANEMDDADLALDLRRRIRRMPGSASRAACASPRSSPS